MLCHKKTDADSIHVEPIWKAKKTPRLKLLFFDMKVFIYESFPFLTWDLFRFNWFHRKWLVSTLYSVKPASKNTNADK